MAPFIMILGLLQMIGGVFVAFVAKSAVHEILGSVSFGFGVLSFALAVIIAKINDAMKQWARPALSPENQMTTIKSVPAGGWHKQ